MLRLRKENFLFKYLQLKLTRKSTRFCCTILNYPHPPKENRALTWYLKNPETTKIQPSRLFLGQAESVLYIHASRGSRSSQLEELPGLFFLLMLNTRTWTQWVSQSFTWAC